jgi:hypothetical protein
MQKPILPLFVVSFFITPKIIILSSNSWISINTEGESNTSYYQMNPRQIINLENGVSIPCSNSQFAAPSRWHWIVCTAASSQSEWKSVSRLPLHPLHCSISLMHSCKVNTINIAQYTRNCSSIDIFRQECNEDIFLSMSKKLKCGKDHILEFRLNVFLVKNVLQILKDNFLIRSFNSCFNDLHLNTIFLSKMSQINIQNIMFTWFHF